MASLREMRIVDVDTHYTEPGDLWTSRAPSKFKDKVLHTRRDDAGKDGWYIDGHAVAPIGPAVIDRNNNKVPGITNLKSFDDMTLAATTTSERLKLMDRLGVTSQIIYPNVIGFGASRLMDLSEDLELRQWHVTAYNDAISALQKETNGRLRPQAVLPFWDIDESIKELERCREKLGLSGLAMTSAPQDFGQPALADEKWDRFWAACQALDVPVNFHIGTNSLEPVIGDYWGSKTLYREDGSQNGALASFLSASLFLANFRQVVNLILTKMLDRYPRLKFVSVESGVGWVPFIIRSLEYSFEDMMTAEERRSYKSTPREYMRNHIYTSYWFENERAVKTYVEEFGADNLMFETDFPHPQALHPGVREKIEETLGSFDSETQAKILFKNAERLYGAAGV
ncbi:MAG: amidohydrolase [Hyphomonadaceae bacterium]|nr:amidohydrolase [Hyphomonadaceae bacterium]